ncbi:MAG TPA: glycoside hydrolase family 9 protein [Anaerolineales bacterium]|nr:glycoside hydrolase family 9 protein [Anaerolineales bacterium]
MKILTNHLGYEPAGPKTAILLGRAGDRPLAFQVRNAGTGEVVLHGTPVEAGPVHKWRDWHFWTLDFSPLEMPGQYFIECGPVPSFPFRLQTDLLERNTLSDVIYYFKAQRCSGALDRADRDLPFAPPRPGRADVHGGWYDASGDYGKHLSHLCYSNFFNPQQTPLTAWALLKTHELLERRADPNFKEYLTRLLDEGLYGADHLVRLKDPAGSFFISIQRVEPGNRPEDRRIAKRMLDYSIASKTKKAEFHSRDSGEIQDYESGYRSGAGLAIAALARAARLASAGEFKPGEYLEAAVQAFAFLEENNRSFAGDGKENILDDYCALLAAVELYRTRPGEAYLRAAQKRAGSLMDRLATGEMYPGHWIADDGDRPFFHPSDAGLPAVSLLDYYEIAGEADRERIRTTLRAELSFELAVTAEVPNPFGYARQLVRDGKGRGRTSFFFPHDSEAAPWWQGENARLASLAAAARLAAPLFREEADFSNKLRTFATDQLNWILGLNPFDACLLDGSGRDNPEYLYFDSYAYANCPGGICNGITSGLHDEDDIDFHLSIPGEDHDWRWGEQWLPHATWYLLAVAARSPGLT